MFYKLQEVLRDTCVFPLRSGAVIHVILCSGVKLWYASYIDKLRQGACDGNLMTITIVSFKLLCLSKANQSEKGL